MSSTAVVASQQPPPLLLTTLEAARLLSISRQQVYRLIDAGRLPRVHVGRAARVPRADVLRLVEELSRETTSPLAGGPVGKAGDDDAHAAD